MTAPAVSVPRMILMPSILALCVTLLRLYGELHRWPRPIVNSEVCGKAILGVTWLVPIFGIYFAEKLHRQNQAPARLGRVLVFAGAGLALKYAGTALMETPSISYAARLPADFAVTTLGLVLPFFAWSRLCKVLLAYGYASRIPVAVVQFFAMRGHWGTHYDALDPGFPAIGFWPTLIRVSLVGNLYFSEVYTVVVGALFGALVVSVHRRFGKAPGPE